MARDLPTWLTLCDLEKICMNARRDQFRKSGLISSLRPNFSHDLAGKSVDLIFEDESRISYQFHRDHLVFSQGDTSTEEEMEILPSARPNVYLVHHLRTDIIPWQAVTLVLDFDRKSATMLDLKFGTIHSNRDVCRTVRFAGIAGQSSDSSSCAHAFTEDLTGVVMDWRFTPEICIHQMYENISCCAFVSPVPDAAPEWSGFFTTFNPTRYIRLADRLYFISFCAPGSTGLEADMLMDLDSMTCTGSAFGIDWMDKLCFYTFGGIGACAEVGFRGQYTV